MEAKQRILFAVLVTVGLAGFAWLVLRPHEPLYQGRPVSSWLNRAFEDVQDSAPQAEGALRSLGTNTLPFLVKLAGTRLYGWRFAVGHMARESDMAFLHLPHQLYKSEMAIWGFQRLGVEGRPAVGDLARLLTDRDSQVRATAACCLAAMGPAAAEAVPALIEMLKAQGKQARDTDNLRGAAAHALGAIGPAAESAMPYLASLTNEFAEIAVIQIQGQSLQPILDRLKDTSLPDRWLRTATLLRRMGTNAEPAIPWLVAASGHTNDQIHTQAVWLMGQLHLRPDLCVPALCRLLDSNNYGLQGNSIEALRRFGPDAKSAVPALVLCLRERNSWIRTEATNALLAIDPAAAVAAGVKPAAP